MHDDFADKTACLIGECQSGTDGNDGRALGEFACAVKRIRMDAAEFSIIRERSRTETTIAAPVKRTSSTTVPLKPSSRLSTAVARTWIPLFRTVSATS